MLRTTNAAQFLTRGLFELFHAQPIGILEHHEHSSMGLFQTSYRSRVRRESAQAGVDWWR
jgi:hypothetical protein